MDADLFPLAIVNHYQIWTIRSSSNGFDHLLIISVVTEKMSKYFRIMGTEKTSPIRYPDRGKEGRYAHTYKQGRL